MSNPIKKLIAGLALITFAGLGRADKGHYNAITGIWRGELFGVPAATLNITDEAGPLQGAILFYLVRRDEGKPAISSPGIPEPLFNPNFDGRSLTFQLSHRHAHTDTASDPPVTFRLELNGSDEANLVRVPQDGPPFMKMVREKH